jgi:hypothetical protein
LKRSRKTVQESQMVSPHRFFILSLFPVQTLTGPKSEKGTAFVLTPGNAEQMRCLEL